MTLYFPQLATGTAGQFPLTKTQQLRTVVNRMADGADIRLSDADASVVAWQLEYRGLSDAERTALASFFDTTRGRLHSFVFLDPCGNLLAHSADLSHRVWEADPLLRVESEEGHARLVNTAQTSQAIRQTVAVPGWFRYCGSACVRSATGDAVRLSIESGGQVLHSTLRAGNDWTVASCSGEIQTDAESLTFGLGLAAGSAVEVRDVQLEPQPGRSGYRRTGARTGHYPETRFDQDELVFRADGIDNHSTSLRLMSRVRL